MRYLWLIAIALGLIICVVADLVYGMKATQFYYVVGSLSGMFTGVVLAAGIKPKAKLSE